MLEGLLQPSVPGPTSPGCGRNTTHVSWRPFPSLRVGHLAVLCQAAGRPAAQDDGAVTREPCQESTAPPRCLTPSTSRGQSAATWRAPLQDGAGRQSSQPAGAGAARAGRADPPPCVCSSQDEAGFVVGESSVVTWAQVAGWSLPGMVLALSSVRAEQHLVVATARQPWGVDVADLRLHPGRHGHHVRGPWGTRVTGKRQTLPRDEASLCTHWSASPRQAQPPEGVHLGLEPPRGSCPLRAACTCCGPGFPATRLPVVPLLSRWPQLVNWHTVALWSRPFLAHCTRGAQLQALPAGGLTRATSRRDAQSQPECCRCPCPAVPVCHAQPPRPGSLPLWLVTGIFP